MKVVNEPVKLMAIFNTNGTIEPVKFVIKDKVVRIEQILKVYEEHFVGNTRIVFVCQHKGSYIYEIKYEIASNTWFFFKK